MKTWNDISDEFFTNEPTTFEMKIGIAELLKYLKERYYPPEEKGPFPIFDESGGVVGYSSNKPLGEIKDGE